MIEVILPKVDMAMTEGTIAAWLRREGEAVKEGDPLFEVETDKANVEVEAPASGTLWGVRAAPGQTVAIAEIVAYILAPGEQPPLSGDREQETGDRGQAAEDRGQKAAPNASQTDVGTQNSKLKTQNSKLRATPLARKISREQGVELALVAGSGPNGRIGGQDVIAFVKGQGTGDRGQESEVRSQESGVRSQESAGGDNDGDAAPRANEAIVNRKSEIVHQDDLTRVPLTSLRKLIAERMVASVREAPHFTLNMSVDMSEAVALRTRVSATIEKQTGAKPSFTVILARALAPLLLRHPQLNAAWDGDAVLLHHRVHLGVALDRAGDLLVPVIRDAHRLSLAELTAALADISARAKSRKLAPDELRGSTFTVSNLGMFGVDSFTAIINAPESAILAVGRIVDTPVARAGALVIRPTMQITLSADHRIVDGATAARFLADLRERLEEPYLLL